MGITIMFAILTYCDTKKGYIIGNETSVISIKTMKTDGKFSTIDSRREMD